jgi:NAD-dependent dihydropyrimidine dehydrogenase PreA subunit
MRYLKNTTSLIFYLDKCTGCKLCIDVCPHNVFGLDGKKVRIQEKDLCMECGACALNCDFDAIYVEKGVGCAAALINSIVKGGEISCDCSKDNESSCC